MQFIWRSTTWVHNIWSSAVLSVLIIIAVSSALEVFYGQEIERKIIDIMWPILGVLFSVLLILRRPKESENT